MKCLRGLHLFVLAGLVAATAGGADSPAPANKPLAAPARPRPEVWMMPPGSSEGRAWRELFEHPEQWAQTRRQVDVVGYAVQNLHKQFGDDELRRWLPMLDQWGLKLGLEVGAVKPWGATGEKCFTAQKKMFDRFQALGGHIYSIAMDEPLCCVRQKFKEKGDAYAVEETAQFIALVRKNYPDAQVGDIEPYPFLQREEMLAFIDALQARLKEMNVRPMDFFRVDVDWNHFTIGNAIHPGNWPDVRKLEIACRQRKLPFSLIYWDADYGKMNKLGLADDSTWYVGVMRQGYDYTFVEGHPDQVVIESWVGAPSHSVPESDPWSFARSVKDFCERFVKPAR